MAKYACKCHEDEEIVKSRYVINIDERLHDLMLCPVPENTVVEYTFNRGYETIKIHTLGYGISEYAGAYHPNVVCEGVGVCVYCGTVMSYG